MLDGRKKPGQHDDASPNGEEPQSADVETPELASADTVSGEAIEQPEEGGGTRIWREVRSWLRDLVIAVVICVLLIVYVAQPFRVEKTSMEPLLQEGDRILVSKISLLFESPQPGDVVVLWNPRNPDESWIKRIIACPGDEVRITDGVVHVNGLALDESYLPEGNRIGRKDTYPPEEAEMLTRRERHLMKKLLGYSIENNPGEDEVLVQRIPEGYYFVLGDNRSSSMDSRTSVFDPDDIGPGLIPARYIYGKAVFRYWPLNKMGIIPQGELGFSESE